MAKEIGRIGQLRYGVRGTSSVFMEEFLPELRGIRGVHTYTEMADNDATIGSIMFAIEMLMRQCEFHMEPGGDAAIDKEAAEFVESCMDDMEQTWADTLSEILSFLPYGWSYHEIVYKRRLGKKSDPRVNSKYDDGLIGWRKLPIRGQDTLEGWDYKEGTDDLLGMAQVAAPDFERVVIPVEKALHFRTRSRKNNPEGRSILRTAYRAYYFKKRLEEIEGYGMERDLAGFPVLYSPADFNVWEDTDEARGALARGEYIVSSIRRDAREGLVLPGGHDQGTGWKLELLSSGGRRQIDTNAIIERYDKRIATTVLADFVLLGQQAVGSFALADSKTKIFALAIGTYLDIICEVFNNQAIPRLIDMNGDKFKGITDYPKMTHGDIEEPDLTQFATYIETMVGAGIIQPDEELEEEVRRIGRLPEKVETKAPREVQPGENNPQNPAGGPGAPGAEGKSSHNVMGILDRYQSGKITHDAAAQLLRGNGLNDEQVNFYMTEADKGKKMQEKEKAAQEAQQARQRKKKGKQEETPADDEKDAQEAQEAKKSLGRK